jgi:DNA-binding IclR family transcriptional regulator
MSLMTNETTDPPQNRQQKVQSAEVGTGVLKALADLAPATSLSHLAEHLGMPAAKVHRYLQALIASGFAEQDPLTNHYGLGREALYVGLAALGRLDVVRIATPHLVALREALNETCFLAVWGNKGPTVVHIEQSVGDITLVTRVGSVLPLLNSSTGMVFDAFLSDSVLHAMREEEMQRGGAAFSKQVLEDIDARRARIRATGLNQIQGLLMPGVNALSAPLFATGDRLVGVLTVIGAASVLIDEHRTAALARLDATARAITARMAGIHPQ